MKFADFTSLPPETTGEEIENVPVEAPKIEQQPVVEYNSSPKVKKKQPTARKSTGNRTYEHDTVKLEEINKIMNNIQQDLEDRKSPDNNSNNIEMEPGMLMDVDDCNDQKDETAKEIVDSHTEPSLVFDISDDEASNSGPINRNDSQSSSSDNKKGESPSKSQSNGSESGPKSPISFNSIDKSIFNENNKRILEVSLEEESNNCKKPKISIINIETIPEFEVSQSNSPPANSGESFEQRILSNSSSPIQNQISLNSEITLFPIIEKLTKENADNTKETSSLLINSHSEQSEDDSIFSVDETNDEADVEEIHSSKDEITLEEENSSKDDAIRETSPTKNSDREVTSPSKDEVSLVAHSSKDEGMVKESSEKEVTIGESSSKEELTVESISSKDEITVEESSSKNEVAEEASPSKEADTEEASPSKNKAILEASPSNDEIMETNPSKEVPVETTPSEDVVMVDVSSPKDEMMGEVSSSKDEVIKEATSSNDEVVIEASPKRDNEKETVQETSPANDEVSIEETDDAKEEIMIHVTQDEERELTSKTKNNYVRVDETSLTKDEIEIIDADEAIDLPDSTTESILKTLTLEDLKKLLIELTKDSILSNPVMASLQKRCDDAEASHRALIKTYNELNIKYKKLEAIVKVPTKRTVGVNVQIPQIKPNRKTRTVGIQVKVPNVSPLVNRSVPAPSINLPDVKNIKQDIKPYQSILTPKNLINKSPENIELPKSMPGITITKTQIQPSPQNNANIIDLTLDDTDTKKDIPSPSKPIIHPMYNNTMGNIRPTMHPQQKNFPYILPKNNRQVMPQMTRANMPVMRHPHQGVARRHITPTAHRAPYGPRPSPPNFGRMPMNMNNMNPRKPIANVRTNGIFTHPAPLPIVTNVGSRFSSKLKPPKPSLNLTKGPKGIVLSWDMKLGPEYEKIDIYEIFGYQETAAAAHPSLWKKIGEVHSLDLPMACTLTHFVEGHKYHFSVRALDAAKRFSNFSSAQTIFLSKETKT